MKVEICDNCEKRLDQIESFTASMMLGRTFVNPALKPVMLINNCREFNDGIFSWCSVKCIHEWLDKQLENKCPETK